MSYIKVLKLTIVEESFYEPSIRFFFQDMQIVKEANDKNRLIPEEKLHSFRLVNATYKVNGKVVTAMVLIGLDIEQNPMLLSGDFAVCGCPPGKEPGTEIMADDK